jgi:hypothetical protein
MKSSDLPALLNEKGFDLTSAPLPAAIDVSRYLARHDIVFRSPQAAGYEGLPLGNGDISLMFWTVPDGLKMQLNKNDTWTQPDSEAPMLLRSCAQVAIDFGQPCNDWIYLDDFEERLCLGEARVRYRTVTPFCTITAEAMVDTESNLVIIDLACAPVESSEDPAAEGPLIRLSLERYGSRAFAGWYNNIRRGAAAGLGLARARAAGDAITVVEPFDQVSGLKVATAACVLGARGQARVVNPRRAEIEWSAGQAGSVTILIALASAGPAASTRSDALTGESEAVMARALQILEQGALQLDEIRLRHSSWWHDYWNRSFLHLSRPDDAAAFDYLENLYYLQFYALGCASRGSYPMIFNAGPYTWNHDVRQWVNPHHWNIQQSYWSPEAANRPELMQPYLQTYSRIVPAARQFAREDKKVARGLVISEMHDFSGRMLSYRGALTPASQIAQQFWNHYLYNQDRTYLEDVAWPFIRDCADFYAEYARLNPETGCYEIGPAAVYECEFGEHFTNTVVDLVTIRYIVPVAIRAAEILGTAADRVTCWQNLLDHLSDFTYLDDEPETLAMGINPDGSKLSFPNQNRGFCRNASPLVPCPIIGFKDQGSRLYQAVRNAAGQYSRNSLAITPISVIWARLGDGNRAFEFLKNAITQLQHFPQGFFYNIDHWFQYSRYARRVDDYLTECQRDYITDHSLSYDDIKVRGSQTGETVDIPMQPFVQCGFETAGILTHALHEMLLQSHEGVIRLLPACPSGAGGLFTLKAAGGFLISCQFDQGAAQPLVIIRSLAGQPCTIDVPFAGRGLVLVDSKGRDVAIVTDAEGSSSFATTAGETYVLAAADLQPDEVMPFQVASTVNNDSKHLDQASLGRPRQF